MGSKILTWGDLNLANIFSPNRYSKNSNYFLQVSFLDENGESIWHDRVVSNEEIYLLRFKKVLEGVINVAGRGYEVGYAPGTVLTRGLTLDFFYIQIVSWVFAFFSSVRNMLVHGPLHQ